MNALLLSFLVLIGCGSNIYFLELIVRENKGHGNIVTFAQFFYFTIEGLFMGHFLFKRPAVPVRAYFAIVSIFLLVQLINNVALNFDIAMPLHMIFRSASLVTNMLMNIIILSRRYSLSKYLSVAMITAGVGFVTFASSPKVDQSRDKREVDDAHNYATWLTGVVLLTVALLLASRLGIYQEQMYQTYGKHPMEAMYYCHALPLPGFVLVARDVYASAVMFNASEPLVLPVLALPVPKLWLYLAGNVLTQWVCIRAVFHMTSQCSSLTLTLVLTLRKFLSLLFSVYYFNNDFTIVHWCGAALVFAGTLIFSEVLPTTTSLRQRLMPSAGIGKKLD